LLLAWALCKLGFEVVLLGAAVGPKTAEDRQHMDHMVLCVLLDEPWLLDAGFGNSFLEPLPLAEGKFQQAFHTFYLRQEGDYWSFENQIYGGSGFDFLLQPRTLDDYATRCRWLQESPDSWFVNLPVCHRHAADHSILSLRNAILMTTHSGGKSQHVIETLEEYAEALTQHFGLQLSGEEIGQLWEKVWPRHLEWVKLNT
jgi:N-hydroxyarylamine O-acetyltransferase